MNTVQSSYAIASALCLFSTGILSSRVSRLGQPLRYLTVYLGLESLSFVLELLVAHPATPLKALWLGLLMSTSLLVAPCLWLAIREHVENTRPTLASLQWKHYAVVVAGTLLTLPLIATSHFGVGFDDPNRGTPTLFESAIHETMLLCIGLFALQVPWYLWRYRKLLLEANSATNPVAPSEHTWLQMPLIVVGTTWLLGVARTLSGALTDGEEQFFALAAFVDVGVTIGSVYFIVRRLVAARPPVTESVLGASSAGAGEPKYAKSQIDAPVRARIVRKLEAAFAADEIHVDGGLSLGSLSRHIKENEHYVSQVINRDLRTTFYELVNQHRIEHAKRLLCESPARNILDIALAVGFNAKSTFNSAFRRQTGITPRQFRSTLGDLSPAGESSLNRSENTT